MRRARLKGPLFSLGASGRLTRALVLARRRAGSVWLLRGRPTQPNTPAQLSWRTMFQLAAALWHDLSAAEQAIWEAAGTTNGMTGYAWYISQALRPNPGIYLPLAGGTMTGDIAMAANQLTGMVDPTAPGEAARKAYVDAQVAGGLAAKACRVRRPANQSIPSGIVTPIIFTDEDYDNDAMWEGVINPGLVTIRTAGLYLIIGQILWLARTGDNRYSLITHSSAGQIAQTLVNAPPGIGLWRSTISTTWDCSVNDTITLDALQNTGTPLDTQGSGNQGNVLSVARIA